MACTSVPLWIIFFLLYGLSLTFLFLSFMSPHLCFASQNMSPTFSQCFKSFNLENAHTYLFPRSQSSLNFIFSLQMVLHLPLGRQEFTISSNFTFFHLSSIRFDKPVGTLQLCFPRRGCG